MEFLNEFQKVVNNVITHMITKVAEEPQGSQCSKQLCEKRQCLLPKLTTQIVSQGKTVLICIKLKKCTF